MFANIKIKTLIIGVLGFLTALLLLVGAFGVYSIRHTADQLQGISIQDVKALSAVEKIRLKMEINRSQILQMLQHNPVMDWAKFHDHQLAVHYKIISDTSTEINDLWARYSSSIASPEEKVLAEEWYAKSGRLGLDSIEAASNAVRGEKWDEAEIILIRRVNPTYRTADTALIELSGLLEKRAQTNAVEVNAGIDWSGYLMSGVAVMGALLAVVAGIILVRGITIPLNRAIEVARRVASGDLGSHIEVSSTNEIGQLLWALGDMNSSLANIVHNVRTATDTISSASTQIVSGNLELSSRTEQHASSLEETASSMEKLTGTVKHNGDNARQANQLALSAAEVATKGGAVVSQVVTTMGAINESSNRIVDIIAVIDGIAFQTNILALNAAVEAARAGEQGRGFAVVASEVRNLAQRSAAAAKEIKALIDNSVEKIETGANLVTQAGDTMEEIVASVKRVTDIMGEIASASEQQGAGIEQVNQAMLQMDRVTQQNASLFEEAAAAAHSLEDQAKHLVQLVSIFTLGTLQAPGASAIRTIHAQENLPGRANMIAIAS